MSRGDEKATSSIENETEGHCSTEDKTEAEGYSKQLGTDTNSMLAASETGSGPALLS